jgi:hypothetical protein
VSLPMGPRHLNRGALARLRVGPPTSTQNGPAKDVGLGPARLTKNKRQPTQKQTPRCRACAEDGPFCAWGSEPESAPSQKHPRITRQAEPHNKKKLQWR